MTVGLKIDGMVAGYRGLPVLHQVSLDVKPGSVVGLLGANGAGKSTVLRAVSGLIGVMGGKVALDGRDVTGRSPAHLAGSGVVHVPEGRGMFPQMSVEDNLALGAYSRGRVDLRGDLDAVFERFPALALRRNIPGSSLSGGEQSMLAIGRALMGKPKLLMLDEPTLGLSPIAIIGIKDVIQQLHAEGITILLVEQNINLALAVADTITVLENGRIAFAGTPKELQEHEDLAAMYLGGKARQH